MPYIEESAKDKFSLDSLVGDIQRNGITPGELNYLVTSLAIAYTTQRGLSYTTINDVLGALNGASLEYYRRTASRYEDIKIIKNGDVYPDRFGSSLPQYNE